MSTYTLTVPCAACNREAGMMACPMCSQIEDAERKVSGDESPQLQQKDAAA